MQHATCNMHISNFPERQRIYLGLVLFQLPHRLQFYPYFVELPQRLVRAWDVLQPTEIPIESKRATVAATTATAATTTITNKQTIRTMGVL